MKNCTNCLYADNCDCTGRCEYYCPAVGFEHIIEEEYYEALRERARDCKEIVDELE